MTQSDDIDDFARDKLAGLEAAHLRRRLFPTKRLPQGGAERDGRRLLSFCDNDYLGLSTDARVIEAARDAAGLYGAGAGASRLVTGECPLNRELETKLAALKGLEAARLFGSGYMANVGVIPVLAGPGDLIVMDALSHACLHAGAKLSGADVATFAHNDVADAARLLKAHPERRRALVITETIFSMDGDRAPLAALNALCNEEGAWLMTDDAHGFGVARLDNPAPVQMGTLSKAAGAYGGYVCGPAAFTELLVSRARSFVYTTGLAPAVLGAALRAVEIIGDEPALGAAARAHARRFAEMLDLPAPAAAIVPLVIGAADRALAISERLADEGFLVSAIRPPTVPAGTARLRFTFTADHRAEDVEALARAVRNALAIEMEMS
ncbi:MAG: 8-amino-7-oxononanoate synthase [Pseudomonadota bacterium]